MLSHFGCIHLYYPTASKQLELWCFRLLKNYILSVITGRIQGKFEVEEGKFYSAEDADRATSTNYLYQEPDCRVGRLPDALASTLPGGG